MATVPMTKSLRRQYRTLSGRVAFFPRTYLIQLGKALSETRLPWGLAREMKNTEANCEECFIDVERREEANQNVVFWGTMANPF